MSFDSQDISCNLDRLHLSRMKHILATLFFLLTIIGFAQTTDLDSLEILDIQEFGFVGQTEAVLIPEGVVAVQIDAYGAQGESGGAPDYAAGGRGAQVSALLFEPLPVELIFSVGGTTGFNGGGSGGQGVNTGNCSDYGGGHGGNGGGYTAVWTSQFPLAEIDDELIVIAGGGGGGGVRYCNCCTYSLEPLPTGGAGGWEGQDALHGSGHGGQDSSLLSGGSGGDQISGGQGGQVLCWNDICSTAPTAGSALQGGSGLTQGWYGVAGGGGGGGYFGGGGGGGGSGGSGRAGAGGGGGSSFVAANTDTLETVIGANEGNGLVRLTFFFQATGCTDPLACNYSSSAFTDDGSCDFCLCGEGTSWSAELSSCIPSFELSDACGEGTVWSDSIQACVSAIALHESCGEGTVWDEDSQTCIIDETYCSWQPDSDGDQLIGVSDLLMFLSVFGDTDLDQDGIFDSNDDCVGEYDECGVCNGSGPSIPIIESIEIQFDSLYAEQIDEWLVYEFADTTFQYVCELIEGCTDSSSYNFSPDAMVDDGSCVPLFQVCGDDILFEGEVYGTTDIFGQCWFDRNLSFLPEVSPLIEGSEDDLLPHAYVYNYNGSEVGEARESYNFQTFGALYNFQAVEQWDLCPLGFHIPTVEEVYDLFLNVGGHPQGGIAGGKMKTTGTYPDSGDWLPPNMGATNETGFSALPSGIRTPESFSDLRSFGYFKTSTPDGINSFVFHVQSINHGISMVAYPKSYAHAIRCIKDTE